VTVTPGSDEPRLPAGRLSRREFVAELDRPWPAGHPRGLRGTLRALAVLMSTSGLIDRPRESIAEAVGIPRRTLDYQIRQAVDLGWLVHTQVGRKHARYGCYTAAQHATSGEAEDGSQHATSEPAGTSLSMQETELAATAQHARNEHAETSPHTGKVARTLLVPLEGNGHGGHDASRTRQDVPAEHTKKPPKSGSTGRASRTRKPTQSRPIREDREETAAAAPVEPAEVVASRGDPKKRGRGRLRAVG
jgi:pyruvate/2-oxoglutarate dehydrogenase complex dihydrolipoamide acyltransferase (E2) component